MRKHIITSISYQEYKDHEPYAHRAEADKRMEQLKNCKHVSKLNLKMVVGD